MDKTKKLSMCHSRVPDESTTKTVKITLWQVFLEDFDRMMRTLRYLAAFAVRDAHKTVLVRRMRL